MTRDVKRQQLISELTLQPRRHHRCFAPVLLHWDRLVFAIHSQPVNTLGRLFEESFNEPILTALQVLLPCKKFLIVGGHRVKPFQRRF